MSAMQEETDTTGASSPQSVVAEPTFDNSEADIIDDTSDFIDMNDAVEVKVDDDNVPMDDDDDDDEQVDDGTITTEEQKRQVVDMSRFQLTSHTDSVYSIAGYLENGQLFFLSGGGDDKAFQYKISTATASTNSTTTPPQPAIESLPYSHSDTVSSVAYNLAYVSDDLKKTPRLAAIGSYDGSIIIYDFDTGTQRLKLEGPPDIEWISFHPKGGFVLLAGSGDGTLWMFHILLNRCLQVFVGHEQAVTAGSFSPDGKWALSASTDGTLRIWAPKTGLNRHVFRLGEAGLTCMATNGGSDGMLAIVGGEDGQAHVCHIGNKKVVATLRHFDPPAEIGTTEGDDDEEMEYPMSVEAVGFSPSQPDWCATGGVDGKLKIWDLSKDGQCRQVCSPPSVGTSENSNNSPTESITRLIWHPTLPLVFTSSASGTIRLWDARNGNLIYTLTGGTEQINDMDIQFVPGSRAAVILTASDDKVVRVFELDVENALIQAQNTATMVAPTATAGMCA